MYFVEYFGLYLSSVIIRNYSNYFKWRSGMAVKHTPTNEVHSGNKGRRTGCGFDTKLHPDHWVSSSQKITCNKNGCKN